MTHRQCLLLCSWIIALGGLGLLAIATRAAIQGVWPAALFIAPMGLALLGVVGFVHRRSRIKKGGSW